MTRRGQRRSTAQDGDAAAPAAPGIDSQALLDAMDGVAWVVDRGATIRSCGRPQWRAFADANGAPALADPDRIVGTGLFDWIAGAEVRAIYRDLLERLFGRRDDRIRFAFRCDAPARRRRMYLTMTPVAGGASVQAVLFQSFVVEEKDRLPVKLFEFENVIDALDGPPDLGDGPLLGMCSFCQRVRWRGPDDEEQWIEAEEYYRRGGPAEVAISHGVCASCAARVKVNRKSAVRADSGRGRRATE